MKHAAGILIFLFFVSLTCGCASTEAQSDESNLLKVSPTLPLVIFEHCLLNSGVSPDDLQDGKIRGKFALQITTPRGSLENLQIHMSQTYSNPDRIFKNCSESAKVTYEHLGPRLAATSLGRSSAPEQTYSYSGDLFPVGSVDVSRNKQFLKTVRMQIDLEQATRPNSRAYRIQIIDLGQPQSNDALASQGTVLELENKNSGGRPPGL